MINGKDLEGNSLSQIEVVSHNMSPEISRESSVRIDGSQTGIRTQYFLAVRLGRYD
jgi:hypothetical protein